MKKYSFSILAAAVVSSVFASIQKPDSKDENFSLDSFRNPPAEFRPVPFWSWNEVMEPEEVKRQIREMKNAGWGGAFVHSRVGLVTEYLGPEWFRAVDATLEECQKQGMLVWLYDEDKWPSGFSGGSVPLASPDFRVKTLFCRNVSDPVPEGAEPLGVPADGMQVYSYTAPMGEGWFNGTSYVDMMSKEAMEAFRKDAYDSYYNRYSKYYGSLIVAEFTDEPCEKYSSRNQSLGGSVAYSKDFVETFKKRNSYDPVPHLYKLFSDVKGAEKFRLDYYRTIDAMFEDNFWKAIGQWCDERGIALTGHAMAETPMVYTQAWSGRIMPRYRHQGIPGIDHLCRRITEAASAKQCASVVNQYGKRRMLSELYGCTGGSLSFEDRKWIALEQICLGVNLLNPHLSLYSMSGCRKRDYPQNIFYQQEWWPLNRYLDDGLSRLCYALSVGKYDSDVLVLHPFESVQAAWCAKENEHMDVSKPSRKTGEEISKSTDAVMYALLNSQMSFDFGDEQLIEEDGFLKDDKIGISNSTYRVVVLPQMLTMRPSTFKLLKDFQSAGGKIFRTGGAVKMLDGQENRQLEEWTNNLEFVEPSKLAEKIDAVAASSVKIKESSAGDPSKVWIHARNLPDGTRMVLLINTSRQQKFEGKVLLRGGFTKAQKYDYNTGTIEDVYAEVAGNELEMPVALDVADGLLLRLGSGISPVKKPAVEKVFAQQELKNWSAEALDDNSLTLDYAVYSCDRVGEKGTGAIPVIEIQRYLNEWKYDGPLSLKYPFKVDGLEKGRRVLLVMEYPERCKIKVNGKEVEYDGLPAWRDFRWMPIDISKHIVQGDNAIELYYQNFKHGDPTIVKPAFDRYGTEIESIYLVGDFSVSAQATGEHPVQGAFKTFGLNAPKVEVLRRDSLALCPPRAISKDKGDVSLQGLPFYTGKLKYSASIRDLKVPHGARAIVEIDSLDCPVAEVVVNGRRAGILQSHPLRVDITDCMAGDITNIDIILYASLRNLLGPHHNKQGELAACGPTDFYSRFTHSPNLHEIKEKLDKWGRGEFLPKDWNDGYCVHSLGEIGDVRLKLVTRQ